MSPLAIYGIAVNLTAFTVCAADKRRAIRRRWRVPEAALMALALAGGSPGLLLGMALLRHKTQKLKFSVVVPLILAAQLVALYVLLGSPGP